MHEQALGDIESEEPPWSKDVFVVLRRHVNGDFQWAV